MKQSKLKGLDYVWLILGSLLLVFVGLRWNVPLAAWLAPVFLIRFFRLQARFARTLTAIPTLAAASYVSLMGGWDDLNTLGTVGISLVRTVPFLIPLYIDRLVARRRSGLLASLAFPVAFVTTDFLLSLSPIGTSLSVAVTQFDAKPLIQLVSLTGIWGLLFLMGWFASTLNTLWEHRFDARAVVRPALAFTLTFSTVLLYGGLRIELLSPQAETVRVAGITVEQQRDYWGLIIDQGTPAEQSHRFDGELRALEDALFEVSARAAQQGAKIVFWSEANLLVHQTDADRFMERAQAFAQQHQIYLVPAVVLLRSGQSWGDNQLYMIEPNGELAYTYTKTKSWYPTDSDGALHTVDTPYGRLSSAICFDMDFPAFVRQAAHKQVDIMLVPAYDWEAIKSFHTQVGLLRAVEYGFSAVRQVNQGTSMAADYRGKVLAYQDYFNTLDRVMLADIPTQGMNTLYGRWGDWLAYAALLFTVGTLGRALFSV